MNDLQSVPCCEVLSAVLSSFVASRFHLVRHTAPPPAIRMQILDTFGLPVLNGAMATQDAAASLVDSREVLLLLELAA